MFLCMYQFESQFAGMQNQFFEKLLHLLISSQPTINLDHEYILF